MVITGRAVAFIAAGAVPAAALGLSVPGLIGLALALLAVLSLDAMAAARPEALALQRSGDTAVRLGESASVRLSVAAGPRPIRGELRDGWVPTAGAAIVATSGPELQPLGKATAGGRVRHGDRVRFRLAAAQEATAELAITPTRRGFRPTDRVTVRSLGPLGLAGRQGTLSAPWAIQTVPPFHSRRHLPGLLLRLQAIEGRNAVRRASEGTEFDSLRVYVPGDDVRSIDWRATARGHDVMLRTYRPERDRRILVILDSGRTAAARIGDGTRLDTSIDATLLLAALAGRAGDHVDMVAFDREPRARVRGARGKEVLPRLTDAFTTLEPSLVETDGRGLVAEALATSRKRMAVVLFTSLDRAPLEESLLPNMGPLLARHTLLVASVADPHLDEMAARRGDPQEVYAAAAAEAARGERAEMAARLRQLGAHVIDRPADQLAPAVAETYLDLKAAGRL